MSKVWINPDFKKLYETPKKEKTAGVKEKKSYKKSSKGKSLKKKKPSPAEAYINHKIQNRKLLTIKFIDNEEITGIIQWADQRYIKFETEDDGLVIEKRAIKYIKQTG